VFSRKINDCTRAGICSVAELSLKIGKRKKYFQPMIFAAKQKNGSSLFQGCQIFYSTLYQNGEKCTK
jgi:hypothetical protein